VTRPPSYDDAGENAGTTPATVKLDLPTAEQLLDHVLRLGREIHLEMDTKALV